MRTWIRVLLILLIATPAFAQSNDFFSNTTLTNKRATQDGTNNDNPGFEPCAGDGTQLNGGVNCDGTGLLSQTKITGTGITGASRFSPTTAQCQVVGSDITVGNIGSPLCGGVAGVVDTADAGKLATFTLLGPGAITDNMFGIISGGANTVCGAEGGGAAATDLLNCGNRRFDPLTQGQLIPTQGSDDAGAVLGGDATRNRLTGKMEANNPMTADFCNGLAASSCVPGNGDVTNLGQDGRHTGIDFTNTLKWNPTTADGCTGGSSTSICVTLTQNVIQVTQTKLTGDNTTVGTLGTRATNVVNVSHTNGTGALGDPRVFEGACTKAGFFGSTTGEVASTSCAAADAGAGIGVATSDQFFKAFASFSITGGKNKTEFTCTGTDCQKVSWQQIMLDPDQSGSGSAFEQNLKGDFVYNGVTTPFGCAAGNQGCAQYPNGATQTNRGQGVTAQDSTLKEQLP